MKGQEQTSEYLVTFETGVRLVGVLIRRLPILIGVFLVSFVVAFLVRNQSPVLFESTSLVVFAPPPYRTARPAAERSGGDEISRMMPIPLSVQDYEIIAKSGPVLKTLRRKTGWKMDGKPIPLTELRERIRAVSQVIKKTNTDIVYSPVLSLTVAATDAEEATKISNAWSDILVEVSKEHARSGAAGLSQFLSSEFEKAGEDFEYAINSSVTRYDHVLDMLNEARNVKERTLADLAVEHAEQTAALAKEVQLDSWRDRVESTGSVLAHLRTELASVEVRIAEKTEAARKAKEQLASLPQTIGLDRGLNETALPLTALHLREEGEVIDFPSVVSEEVNEVYIAVGERLTMYESELAGALAEKATIEAAIARLQSEREELTREVKDRELKMTALATRNEAEMNIRTIELAQSVDRLQMQVELEKSKVDKQMEGQSGIYSELNARVLGARLAEAEIQPDLRVLVRAVTSQDSLPRRRVFTAGGIAIAMTALASIVVLLLEAMRNGGELRRRTAST